MTMRADRIVRNIAHLQVNPQYHTAIEGPSMRDRTKVGDNGAVCDHGESWRKSSYSMSNGQCLEITRFADGNIGVRDSKTPQGGVLRFEPGTWVAFTTELRTSPFFQG